MYGMEHGSFLVLQQADDDADEADEVDDDDGELSLFRELFLPLGVREALEQARINLEVREEVKGAKKDPEVGFFSRLLLRTLTGPDPIDTGWQDGWFPFAHDGCGDFLVVECVPETRASDSPVHEHVHDDDDEHSVSPSLQALCETAPHPVVID